MIHYPNETIIVKFGDMELHANAEVLMMTYMKAHSLSTENIKRTVSSMLTIPALGEYWLDQGGIYAGIMRGKNGQPSYHLIHATKEYEIAATSWKSAVKKATAVINGFTDWSLPDLRETRLLAINSPDDFDQDDLYWTSEHVAGYAGYAWLQDFPNGGHDSRHESNDFRARAVRRVLIIQ
jgi:hypothetical protein